MKEILFATSNQSKVNRFYDKLLENNIKLLLDIIVLYKSDMEKYLKYVHDNYTNNLIELYNSQIEKNNYLCLKLKEKLQY